jgi:hypothetical protein
MSDEKVKNSRGHKDVGSLRVSRETEPDEGAGERSSLILLRKMLYAELNC